MTDGTSEIVKDSLYLELLGLAPVHPKSYIFACRVKFVRDPGMKMESLSQKLNGCGFTPRLLFEINSSVEGRN